MALPWRTTSLPCALPDGALPRVWIAPATLQLLAAAAAPDATALRHGDAVTLQCPRSFASCVAQIRCRFGADDGCLTLDDAAAAHFTHLRLSSSLLAIRRLDVESVVDAAAVHARFLTTRRDGHAAAPLPLLSEIVELDDATAAPSLDMLHDADYDDFLSHQSGIGFEGREAVTGLFEPPGDQRASPESSPSRTSKRLQQPAGLLELATPTLGALLDGVLLCTAAPQLRRVRWFGSVATLELRVVGTVRRGGGDGGGGINGSGVDLLTGVDLPSVQRIRSGSTRILTRRQPQHAWTAPAVGSGRLLRPSSVLPWGRWIHTADSIAPGHLRVLRLVVSLACSALSPPPQPPPAPHSVTSKQQPPVSTSAGNRTDSAPPLDCEGANSIVNGNSSAGIPPSTPRFSAAASARRRGGGVLLVGPPGVGKSTLAAAIARASGLPSFRLTSTALYKGGVGASEGALARFLASVAATNTPSIVLLEDVETLLQAGGARTPSALVVRVRTALLRAIEGVQQSDACSAAPPPSPPPVFWIGCAPSLAPLYPTATSPGLLETVIHMRLPTPPQRWAVLRHALRGLACDDEGHSLAALDGEGGGWGMGGGGPTELLSAAMTGGGHGHGDGSGGPLLCGVARRTHGYTPADLMALVREACLHRIRRDTDASAAADTSAASSSTRVGLFDSSTLPPPQPDHRHHPHPPRLHGSDFAAGLAVVKPSLLLHAVGAPPSPACTLAPLLGCEHAIAAATAAVLTPLRHADEYAALGVAPPRGLLIHGPSGTGKSTLAHAIANAASGAGLANAMVVCCPDIVTSAVGGSEAALAATFSRARELAPCILVLDQFECLAPSRTYRAAAAPASPAAAPAAAVASVTGAPSSAAGGGGGGGAAAGPPVQSSVLGVSKAGGTNSGNVGGGDSDSSVGAAGSLVSDRLLSVLLVEMDGIGGSSGVVGSSGGDSSNSSRRAISPCPSSIATSSLASSSKRGDGGGGIGAAGSALEALLASLAVPPVASPPPSSIARAGGAEMTAPSPPLALAAAAIARVNTISAATVASPAVPTSTETASSSSPAVPAGGSVDGGPAVAAAPMGSLLITHPLTLENALAAVYAAEAEGRAAPDEKIASSLIAGETATTVANAVIPSISFSHDGEGDGGGGGGGFGDAGDDDAPAAAKRAMGFVSGGGGGGVIVVAVTHDIRLLDPAVTRPGRLDSHVLTRLPSLGERAAVLEHYFSGTPVDVEGSPWWAQQQQQGRRGRAHGSISAALSSHPAISTPHSSPSADCVPAAFTELSGCRSDDPPPASAWTGLLSALAARTAGWSHADLAGLWRESAMGALRRAYASGDAAEAVVGDAPTSGGEGEEEEGGCVVAAAAPPAAATTARKGGLAGGDDENGSARAGRGGGAAVTLRDIEGAMRLLAPALLYHGAVL